MKQANKNHFCGLRAACAAALLLAAAAARAQNAESDFETDGKGTITKYAGWDAAAVIPARIGGKPVIAIGKEAFANNDLTGVTIPGTVKTIGESAFAGNKLTSVTIPDGIVIAEDAFSHSGTIKSVTLGKNSIFGSSAFTNSKYEFANTTGANLFYDYVCNDRKAGTYTVDPQKRQEKKDGDFEYVETKYGAYITGYSGSSGNRLQIPEKVNALAVKAIGGLRGITRVRIPQGVSYIADHAFSRRHEYGGGGLTEIAIPASVTHIGAYAFAGNPLTSVTIPDSVISIGAHAFSEGEDYRSGGALSSVTIGKNVTSIGDSAFSGNNLTGVILPAGLISIGDSAFAGNDGITAITIPGTVTSVGGAPAKDFIIGANVTVGGGRYQGDFGRFYDENGKKAGRYFSDKYGYWEYSAQ
jgi:hypothetical protein